MRFLLTVVLLSSTAALAQQPTADQAPPPVSTGTPADVDSPSAGSSLASQFLGHNFVNFYAFVNAMHDGSVPVIGGSSNGSWGFNVGGGVDLDHRFETAIVTLTYRGNYTDYGNNSYGGGTNQNLAFTFSKRLNQRWSTALFTNGGIYLYGAPYYNPNVPAANPFSSENRYLSSGIVMSYQQTRRLSYSVSGNFFLNRYNYPYAIGSTGGIGALSANYRLNHRTTLSGTFSHSAFYFQQNAGSSKVESIFASATYRFNQRTTLSVSGGAAYANSQGETLIPVQGFINGQPALAVIRVPYNETGWIPAFHGSLSHGWRKFQFTVAAGQTVTPGNGYYLTSRNLFLNGTISRSWHRSNVSAGGGYYHLVSLANSVAAASKSGSIDSGSLTVSYGYVINRYFGFHAGYSYFKNGSFGSYNTYADNRITFGLTFSSKGIPLTLF